MKDARASANSGHGLPNIERRVRNLGGIHTFSAGALGGTLLSLSVPLEVVAEITADITTGKTAPSGEGPAGAIR